MPAKFSDLETVFSTLVKSVLVLVGLTSLVMIVIGGYQFLMAGGDKEGAAKARNTITYAIIGLILAVSAWLILSIFGAFIGVSFQSFGICLPGQVC